MQTQFRHPTRAVLIVSVTVGMLTTTVTARDEQFVSRMVNQAAAAANAAQQSLNRNDRRNAAIQLRTAVGCSIVAMFENGQFSGQWSSPDIESLAQSNFRNIRAGTLVGRCAAALQQAQANSGNPPALHENLTQAWIAGGVTHQNIANRLVGTHFEPDGNKAYMTGTIDERTKPRLNALLNGSPNIDTVVMVLVPGSTNDEQNLVAARVLRNPRRPIATHLAANGVIQSGGVDFFIAGARRTKAPNAFTMIGVHSWQDDLGRSGLSLYQRGQDQAGHALFIDFYREMGLPDPRGFYEFTLNSAPASGIHQMTDQELKRFGILTGRNDPRPTPTEFTVVVNNASKEVVEVTKRSANNGAVTRVGFLAAGDAPLQLAVMPGTTVRVEGRGTSFVEQQVQQDNTVVTYSGTNPDPPPPPRPQGIVGIWREIRTDNRRIATTIFPNNTFRQTERGEPDFLGRITIVGDRLTIIGNDGSAEEFRFRRNGNRIDFFERDGTPIRQFHWKRQ